jgi:hypothetical protein
MSHRGLFLIVRVLIATLITVVFATVPLPSIPSYKWVAFVQVPIVVFLFICYIGKLIVDTFYYNHYKY